MFQINRIEIAKVSGLKFKHFTSNDFNKHRKNQPYQDRIKGDSSQGLNKILTLYVTFPLIIAPEILKYYDIFRDPRMPLRVNRLKRYSIA